MKTGHNGQHFIDIPTILDKSEDITMGLSTTYHLFQICGLTALL